MRGLKSKELLLSALYKIDGVIMIGIAIFVFIIKNGSRIYVDITYGTITTMGIINSLIQVLAIPLFILAGITLWCTGIDMNKNRKKKAKNFNFIL